MLASLLTFFVVGLIALVAVSIVLALVGTVFSIAFSIAGFLLFKVAPILLIGYLIVRFLAPKSRRIDRMEREWLEE